MLFECTFKTKLEVLAFCPLTCFFLAYLLQTHFVFVYINQGTGIIVCVNRPHATDVVFLPIILILLCVYLYINLSNKDSKDTTVRPSHREYYPSHMRLSLKLPIDS